MSMENYFAPGVTMAQYLADLGRTSGSVLSLVERNPELYEAHLQGKNIDRPSAAKGRGSYVHARLTEPKTVAETFAFYPNRNEAKEPVMREVVGPRGGKKLEPTGEKTPQDSTERGRYLSMLRNTAAGKQLHKEFMAGLGTRTVVFPEDQPGAEASIRSVRLHGEAAALLEPDPDFAPELTGHYTCPETGELMKIRPDAVRIRKRIWIELKTVHVKDEENRLDTLNPAAVLKMVRLGSWPRKSYLLHSGCSAITGDNWTGRWIVIESLSVEQLARGWRPRVSVVHDDPEVDGVPSLYLLGRNGGGGMTGALDLIRTAQRLRSSQDFRHDCVRQSVPRWNLPGWLENELMVEKEPGRRGDDDDHFVPPIIGGTPLEEYEHGQG